MPQKAQWTPCHVHPGCSADRKGQWMSQLGHGPERCPQGQGEGTGLELKVTLTPAADLKQKKLAKRQTEFVF